MEEGAKTFIFGLARATIETSNGLSEKTDSYISLDYSLLPLFERQAYFFQPRTLSLGFKILKRTYALTDGVVCRSRASSMVELGVSRDTFLISSLSICGR